MELNLCSEEEEVLRLCFVPRFLPGERLFFRTSAMAKWYMKDWAKLNRPNLSYRDTVIFSITSVIGCPNVNLGRMSEVFVQGYPMAAKQQALVYPYGQLAQAPIMVTSMLNDTQCTPMHAQMPCAPVVTDASAPLMRHDVVGPPVFLDSHATNRPLLYYHQPQNHVFTGDKFYLTPSSSGAVVPQQPSVPVEHSPVSSDGGLLIFCSPEGVISVLLKHDIIVELTIDKVIRVISTGKFAAASHPTMNAASVNHPKANVYQEDVKVLASFMGSKVAQVSSQGVMFTMAELPNVYLVSMQNQGGTKQIPREKVIFPDMPKDMSVFLLHNADCGAHVYQRCYEMIHKAHYNRCQDGTVSICINGITIKQSPNGDVEVLDQPRLISVSPTNGTLSLRTHYVHIGIQADDKAFIKRGVKRVHVSSCGMVISDGNQSTSLDFMGRVFDFK